jgi:hypothetical protein
MARKAARRFGDILLPKRPLGPHFGQELQTAGLSDLLSFAPDGSVYGDDRLTPQQRAKLVELIEGHKADGAPRAKRSISKAKLFEAMDDPEYDKFLPVYSSQNKRLQAIFNNAWELQEGHPLFEKLVQLLTATYGAERAEELLNSAWM